MNKPLNNFLIIICCSILYFNTFYSQTQNDNSSTKSILINNISGPDISSSNIKFWGTTKFYTQYSSRQGTNSQIPRNLWRWDLNTTLSVSDINFNFLSYTTSEQKDITQNINTYRISISAANRNTNRSFLGDFFSMFSSFNIGTLNVNYSPLTINGIYLLGINFEFTPGIFYLAFTSGKTQNASEGNATHFATYKRNLLAAKIGLGEKYKTHFYLTAGKSWDDISSIKNDSSTVKPQENYFVGAESKVSLFNQIFNIEGEFVASIITKDTKSAKLESDLLPGWIEKIFTPTINTSVDYAYQINSSINLPSDTKFGVLYKYVGPGFISHGTPYLRNDNRAYEIKAEQSLFNRNISAKIYYKNSIDNLIPWKFSRTTISSYGISLGMRFKDIPYLQINYSPYFQENDSKIATSMVNNKTNLISVMTGYTYRIGKLQNTSNLFMSYQNNDALNTMSNYTNSNISFNQSIEFEFPLLLSATFGLIQSEFNVITNRIYTYDFSGSFTVLENWVNSIGINYSTTKDIDKRTGFYLSSTFPVFNLFNVELRGMKNIYDDLLYSGLNYNENIFQFIIRKNW